ncbi:MAG: T9SS type A sorting domain-containing protein [Cytophagales bacterium]
MIRTIFFTALCYLLQNSVAGQDGNIPLNSWRYHTSFYNAKVIAQAENKIYCGTEGGLFYFDKTDNTINKFSKLDGLNDLEVNALYYHKPTKSLIIGYKTGNIDIVRESAIYNLPFIVNAGNITGSKKINAISSYQNTALVACDFGVILLNLSKLEIQESWLNIAENGSALVANDIATVGDSVFVASNKGLYCTSFDKRNLMDFNNWGKTTIVNGMPSIAVAKLTTNDAKLTVGIDFFGVFTKSGSWKNIFRTNGLVKTLSNAGSNTWLFTNGKLGNITSVDTNTIQINEISQVNALLIDENESNTIWLADGNNGLVKYNLQTQSTNKIVPNGLLNNFIFNTKAINEYVFHFSGAFDQATTPKFRSPNYSYFYKGEWYANTKPSEFGLQDFGTVGLNTKNGNFYFASSWNGLVEKNNDNFTAYNENSTTCPVHAEYGARVLDIFYDEKADNLWFANVAPNAKPSIQKFKDGNCTGYNFPASSALYPGQILADNSGNIWVRLLGRVPNNDGILVFNESKMDNATPIHQYLKKGEGIGNLGDNVAKCMAKDRNGDIWVGTNNGVSVFYNPGSLANGRINDATSPIYENRPLLFEQIATCIEIDGGNRKWIGTNRGIYLFNAEGNNVIHYFNKENSPLISNNIVSVSINQISGEVFIGTDVGIVSFREPATLGNESGGEVEIFPNPLKTNFTGTVGFSGLATDATVKITDINGRLLYETKANGGTAQWNARDYNGKKIEPGVYVVLTSKSDGSSPSVGKLFVID